MDISINIKVSLHSVCTMKINEPINPLVSRIEEVEEIYFSCKSIVQSYGPRTRPFYFSYLVKIIRLIKILKHFIPTKSALGELLVLAKIIKITNTSKWIVFENSLSSPTSSSTGTNIEESDYNYNPKITFSSPNFQHQATLSVANLTLERTFQASRYCFIRGMW